MKVFDLNNIVNIKSKKDLKIKKKNVKDQGIKKNLVGKETSKKLPKNIIKEIKL